MNICLPKENVQKFREALASRKLNLTDLLDARMTSEARTKIFEEYAGGNAKLVNQLFESKLVLKNRILGLQNLMSKLGEFGKNSPEAKAATAKAMQDYKNAQTERIFSPSEHETFLNDLADKKVGFHVSDTVAKKVFELTQKANELKAQGTANISGAGDEYLKAVAELHDYVAAQRPTSAGASIFKNLSTIARNNFLLAPSTPIKTTIGQLENTAIEAVVRRLGNRSLGGLVGDVAAKANSEAWTTFRKTGLNTAAMQTVDDAARLGEGKNFDQPQNMSSAHGAVGAVEKGVRTVAKISNKVAIDYEHNYTFTKFYQKAFFDAANIISSKVAKGDAGSAEVIMRDAARIEPLTAEGKMVRAESQKQAARVTSTNATWAGEAAIYVKNYLNTKVQGLGDVFVPIAKIPANLIANGIENAGVGIPLGLKDIYQGHSLIQSADVATRYEGMAQYARGFQRLGRTVGTLALAAYITNQLSAKDFKSDTYGNHFVKVGNYWINTEYIAAFAPALAGMMEMKARGKPGQGVVASGAQYISGASAGLKNLPVVDEVNSLVTAVTNANPNTGLLKYLSNFFYPRVVPSAAKDLTQTRPLNRLFFGASGVETMQQTKADAEAKAKAAAKSRSTNQK